MLKRRLRKVLRRRAWAEYRDRHAWAEKDLVPVHAFRALFLSMAAVVLFLEYEAYQGMPLRILLVSLLALVLVGALLSFLLDLDAPRQKPFQTGPPRTSAT